MDFYEIMDLGVEIFGSEHGHETTFMTPSEAGKKGVDSPESPLFIPESAVSNGLVSTILGPF